jgi:endonuclease G
MVIRDLYALSLNGQTKLADWVCYYLTPKETHGPPGLPRNWQNDPWLRKGEALEVKPKDDYDGVGVVKIDRGHMTPLASVAGSPLFKQVNIYTNIMPQKKDLNEGPWEKVEEKVRGLVDKYGHVWGMSGPLYEKDMPPLPKATKPHKVPSGFWMVVVASAKENPQSPKDLKVAAFIMDQDALRKDDPQKAVVSVDDVQKRSKLNFFWELSATDQQTLESQTANDWVKEWFKKEQP